jgi:hypothetical protein
MVLTTVLGAGHFDDAAGVVFELAILIVRLDWLVEEMGEVNM